MAKTLLPLALLPFVLWSCTGTALADDALDLSKLPPAATVAVDFTRDIQPLLAARCYECHGPNTRESGLRLDDRTAALDGGDQGRDILPGKSAESRLIHLVSGLVADSMMPPEGEPLTAVEVGLLRAWIDAGAPWNADANAATDEQPKHWAYVAPVRPSLPAVQDLSWPRGELDYFVLARIEAAGLKPSPPAPRASWLRRASLDLIGLPPTLEELDTFLADESPQAFEHAVDRLLASPHYGERWARHWLDLARYADTQGYEKDNRRVIWPYRDWVIRALNRDLPFDEFTIEQLAGDLLPEATVDQRVATGFHRNTMCNTEGGTDNEEFRNAAVVDRVNTTFAVWLGTTFNCCQCHSHKYDPFTQREYYQFFAFLNNTADADTDDDAPRLPVPTPEEEQALAAHQAAVAQLEAQLQAVPAELTGGDMAQLPESIRAIAAVPVDQRTPEQRAELAKFNTERDPALARAAEELDKLQKNPPAVTSTPVYEELAEPRTTRIQLRGNFLDPSDEVSAGVPAVLHALPEDAPKNRLTMAHWLVDPRNPLVARVLVNRLWEQYFGRGIVETCEDFGTQGDRPTNPELLDWLATELVRLDWSLKAMHRTIVLSATYRQSSHVAPELAAHDPDNRLLARGPRLRLEAEMVRDQALAASGLLSAKMYGPSVMPPQPDGVWQVVYSGDTWNTSAGEDRYRRGIYTFWRRTSPHPMMTTFDAPSREVCVVRRSRSNTPLQALVTLNDPVFVEAAQALARRMLLESGASPAERIERGFRLCVARRPEADETARLVALVESELAAYRQDPEAAARMATEPLGPVPTGLDTAELAAWTVVANVLLNLDETLTKG
ncbi:MAG: PSD1 and planctomycete cytochrome C domain-containing protein [Pirellulales bacterium]|nr:PSD1 and planctomycete cytochrome C domain-containing protein [Pirellulales bacterium]